MDNELKGKMRKEHGEMVKGLPVKANPKTKFKAKRKLMSKVPTTINMMKMRKK